MEATVPKRGVKRHLDLVEDFLAQRTIAVVGVTRTRESPANGIYKRLVEAGYDVYAVNPHTESFRGRRCFRSVLEFDVPVDGVFILTRPEVTEKVVEHCIARSIPRIWIHNMLGSEPRRGRRISASTSSVSSTAVERARRAGITVIAGGCPLQHIPPVDPFHRCVFWLSQKMGNYASAE